MKNCLKQDSEQLPILGLNPKEKFTITDLMRGKGAEVEED
jgi:hypothetical protein